MKSIELSNGYRAGRLKVIAKEGIRNRHMYYKCICDCGKEIITRGSALTSGNTTSCGCAGKEQRDRMVASRKKNGVKDAIGKVTVEYTTWRHIRSRCNNKKDPKFPNYGGRGIIVCQRWNDSFDNFLMDMGKRPSGCNSIDRIDVNGHYEPSNCRWATDLEQAANKTTTVKLIVEGKEIHQAELARILCVNDHSISNHIAKGKTGDQIVEYFKNKRSHVA